MPDTSPSPPYSTPPPSANSGESGRTWKPEDLMSPAEIARYCPACDPDFPRITTHSKACVIAAAQAEANDA